MKAKFLAKLVLALILATTTGLGAAGQATAGEVGGPLGATLFNGAFAAAKPGYDPEYRMQPGDTFHLSLFGAVNQELDLVVDPQGMAPIPQAGPVRLDGVRAADLDGVLRQHLAKTFRQSVGSYAALSSAQPLRVFVAGEAVRPGLYNGFAGDSPLQFIDQAGGIDLQRGGFRNIQLLRGGVAVAHIDLYRFILEGRLDVPRLQAGDTLLIGARGPVVTLAGAAARTGQFELPAAGRQSVAELLAAAAPRAEATHVRLGGVGAQSESAYYALASADLGRVILQGGEALEVVSQRRSEQITVTVSGEFHGDAVLVLERGASLADALEKIVLDATANPGGVSLYRPSVAKRQQEFLEKALHELEAMTLQPSSTREEAAIRASEATNVRAFVEKARQARAHGQVTVAGADPKQVLLEDGDRINVPARDATVLVQGEVLTPATHAKVEGADVDDYIGWSGGYSRLADTRRVLVRETTGRVTVCAPGHWLGDEPRLRGGEEILVLPQIDSKDLQFGQALVDIIYKVAVATSVVLKL